MTKRVIFQKHSVIPSVPISMGIRDGTRRELGGSEPSVSGNISPLFTMIPSRLLLCELRG